MFFGPPPKKLWNTPELTEQEEQFARMLGRQFPSQYNISCEKDHDTVKWVSRGRNKTNLAGYGYTPVAIFPGSDVCFVCGAFEHRFFQTYGYSRDKDEGFLPEAEEWEYKILAWAVDLGYPWGYEPTKE